MVNNTMLRVDESLSVESAKLARMEKSISSHIQEPKYGARETACILAQLSVERQLLETNITALNMMKRSLDNGANE